MSAYFKTLTRSVKNNFGRFIAITAIIMLGIAFVSGLGTLSYKMEGSFSDYYKKNEIADIIIKSTEETGLLNSQIEKISKVNGVSKVQEITMIDAKIEEKNTRIYVLPLNNMHLNKIVLLDGNYPSSNNEVLVERASDFIEERKIGDKIEVLGEEKTISGIAANPLILYVKGEPDLIDKEPLEQIIYIDKEFTNLPLPITDLYVSVETINSNYFSKAYNKEINSVINQINLSLQDESLKFLSLQGENKSVAIAKAYSEKIDVITLIFPIFFIAVAALVVLTTMTRMIEEDRASIGCYKTLGYSDISVIMKYVSFSALSCLIGSILGLILGVTLLPAVIYPAFNVMFFIPPMINSVDLTIGIIATVSMFAAIVFVSLYLIIKELHSKPAELLRPKAPRPGKKIFLEKIPFLWKRFSFRYKSTLRNIFRYVKHLIMTVLSVAGSTALVLAGFGLQDISTRPSGDVGDLAGAFSMISLVVIAFAVLLCILVIYNLTNMNIGERKREIATLKVLGYHEGEVAGYIYREIFIMAFMGIIIGLPLGFALLYFVFHYMDFGAIQDVQWYSYILSAVLVIVVIGIVDLMLWRKISKIDMTSSLKTIE